MNELISVSLYYLFYLYISTTYLTLQALRDKLFIIIHKEILFSKDNYILHKRTFMLVLICLGCYRLFYKGIYYYGIYYIFHYLYYCMADISPFNVQTLYCK